MAGHASRPARRLSRVASALAVAVALVLPGLAFADPSPAPPPCKGATEKCGAASNGTSIGGVIVFPGWQSGEGADGTGGVSSTCEGCQWYLTPACWPNGPDNGPDVMCGAAAMTCAARGEDGILMRVYLKRPGSGWQPVGTACVGGQNDVRTLADLQVDASRVYREQMHPGAATIRQEDAYVLVNHAAYFSASGAAPLTTTFGPNGASMTITAEPTYVWDWADGSDPFETTSTGGPYPDGDVKHVYRVAGTRSVTLTTRWSATFVVRTALGTFGPYPVTGAPVAPTTSLDVHVQEARAELIGHSG